MAERCGWALGASMIAYHDEEWGVPSHDDRHLFELLVLEGAQAGLSWRTILDKRDSYRGAFANFEPAAVAEFGDEDLARLLADAGIVRNRQKIASAITNARVVLELADHHGSYSDYLWSFVDGTPVVNRFTTLDEVPAETELSRAVSKELKRRGMNFVGPTVVYSYLQAAGLVMDHLLSCPRSRALAGS